MIDHSAQKMLDAEGANAFQIRTSVRPGSTPLPTPTPPWIKLLLANGEGV
jgi:hypothetical protein